MRYPITLDAAQLALEPMRAICAAHHSSAPPIGLTFIIPPRSWDFGHDGSVRVSMVIQAPNGLAQLSVTRRGACAVIDVGMTMIGLAHGSTWFWVHDGRRRRKLWLWPDCNALSTRKPRLCEFHSPMDAAHVRLIALYRSFGLVWTGDQPLPARPQRMTHERYGRLVARIRAQWDVLSGRQPND